MKPVLQRTDQDCLAASIASILELPLELVPVFPRVRTGEGQRRKVCAWLAGIGYSMIELDLQMAGAIAVPKRPIWCIATVNNPGYHWNHAVVSRLSCKGVDIVFDPQGCGFRDPKSKVLSIALLVRDMFAD